MSPRKTKAIPVHPVIISLGTLSIAFALVVPWLPWWKLLWPLALASFVFTSGALTFLAARHMQLLRHRRQHPVRWKRRHGDTRQVPRQPSQDYYLMVLGSGGHTKEMLMMMDDGFCDFEGFHRRYLVSGGDRMSLNHLEDYEADLGQLCDEEGRSAGSYDVRFVTRARRVHQPLLTTPFTALASLYDIIFNVLLSSPPQGEPAATELRYPRMIFSNGPATGFFVALAVHILKMIYVIPQDRCFFVYIESWARISTLSLTGKLFHHTGLADGFAVQHVEVASIYGVEDAGPMVFNSRRAADDAPSTGQTK